MIKTVLLYLFFLIIIMFWKCKGSYLIQNEDNDTQYKGHLYPPQTVLQDYDDLQEINSLEERSGPVKRMSTQSKDSYEDLYYGSRERRLKEMANLFQSRGRRDRNKREQSTKEKVFSGSRGRRAVKRDETSEQDNSNNFYAAAGGTENTFNPFQGSRGKKQEYRNICRYTFCEREDDLSDKMKKQKETFFGNRGRRFEPTNDYYQEFLGSRGKKFDEFLGSRGRRQEQDYFQANRGKKTKDYPNIFESPGKSYPEEFFGNRGKRLEKFPSLFNSQKDEKNFLKHRNKELFQELFGNYEKINERVQEKEKRIADEFLGSRGKKIKQPLENEVFNTFFGNRGKRYQDYNISQRTNENDGQIKVPFNLLKDNRGKRKNNANSTEELLFVKHNHRSPANPCFTCDNFVPKNSHTGSRKKREVLQDSWLQFGSDEWYPFFAHRGKRSYSNLKNDRPTDEEMWPPKEKLILKTEQLFKPSLNPIIFWENKNRREPLYVEEPQWILVRRTEDKIPQEMPNIISDYDPFFVTRGKKQLQTIEQISKFKSLKKLVLNDIFY